MPSRHLFRLESRSGIVSHSLPEFTTFLWLPEHHFQPHSIRSCWPKNTGVCKWLLIPSSHTHFSIFTLTFIGTHSTSWEVMERRVKAIAARLRKQPSLGGCRGRDQQEEAHSSFSVTIPGKAVRVGVCSWAYCTSALQERGTSCPEPSRRRESQEQPRCEDKQTGLLHQTTCLEVPFGGEAVWAPQLMHLGPPVRC